jgi:hypothetical protein
MASRYLSLLLRWPWLPTGWLAGWLAVITGGVRATALIGCGASAATSLRGLQQLGEAAASTGGCGLGEGVQVVWITRRPLGHAAPDSGGANPPPGPYALVDGDPLPQRDALYRSANAIAGAALLVSPRAACCQALCA